MFLFKLCAALLIVTAFESVKIDEFIALTCFKLDEIERQPINFIGMKNVDLDQKYNETTKDESCSFNNVRHHIIPFDRIKSFFKLALEIQDPSVHEKVKKFVQNLIINAAPEYDATESAIQQLKNYLNDEQFRFAEVLDLFDSEQHGFVLFRNQDGSLDHFTGQSIPRTMASVIHWMPFNWFEGPDRYHRTDEPGGTFELGCKRIVGSDAFLKLINANDLIQACSHNSDENIKKLHLDSVLAEFTDLLNLKPTGYDYNLNDWKLINIEKNRCKFRIKDIDEARRKRSLKKNAIDPYCWNTYSNIQMIENYQYSITLLNKTYVPVFF